MKLVDDRSKI